ncbi:hypothetical protein RJT34_11397 [Clitoria ternatea]|uniref:Uncharacterized protein n=1 Tax=Clitoria ternatea TaxID=43366 RepID=A0AAN9JLV4_CLITE
MTNFIATCKGQLFLKSHHEIMAVGGAQKVSNCQTYGEELSKKQAAQESTIRKLRAQIRDLEEEEEKGLATKLKGQVHANNEARTKLKGHLREAEERESMLVQTLEELRQTLSRKEQQISIFHRFEPNVNVDISNWELEHVNNSPIYD